MEKTQAKFTPEPWKTPKLDQQRCHICSSWTPLSGCNHYGPQGFSENEHIVNAITAFTSGSGIEETGDFYMGINAALLFLRENKMLDDRSAAPEMYAALDKMTAICERIAEDYASINTGDSRLEREDRTHYFTGEVKKHLSELPEAVEYSRAALAKANGETK